MMVNERPRGIETAFSQSQKLLKKNTNVQLADKW